MSHAITQTDETISSDNWSHVTQGDGLIEMVQYFCWLLMFKTKTAGSAVTVERIFSGGWDTISLWWASLCPDTIWTLTLVKQHLHVTQCAIHDWVIDILNMNVFIQTLLDHNYSYYHLWPYYMMYCTIRVTEIEVYGTGDSMEGSHIYTDGKGVAGRESRTRRRWGGGSHRRPRFFFGLMYYPMPWSHNRQSTCLNNPQKLSYEVSSRYHRYLTAEDETFWFGWVRIGCARWRRKRGKGAN